MSSKVKEFSSESGNKTLGKHQNRICNIILVEPSKKQREPKR